MKNNKRKNTAADEAVQPYSDAYDYVIVGGGSAGCVVARRLAEGSDARILLLEAGESPENMESIPVPQRWLEHIGSPYDYLYPYQTSEILNNRQIYAPRGKLLGGSGVINAMIWARGHEDDYNAWAAAGNTGWDYESLLPLFKKTEDWEDGQTELHGSGGPMHIETAKNLRPIDAAVISAAESYGIPYKKDMNERKPGSVSPTNLTIRDGIRSSPFNGYLQPALQRNNLTVITGAAVTKLKIENDQCNGLEYLRNGEVFFVTADKEVILSAGAFESPRILMLSGIGSAEDLTAFGIECKLDLPGVGRNLQDHPLLALTFQAKEPIGEFTYNLGGSVVYWKSKPAEEKADVMLLPIQVPVQNAETMARYPIPENSFGIFVTMVNVQSRGYLKMTGAEYNAPLEIQPNLLQDPEDMERMMDAVELCLDLAEQQALRDVIKSWVAPAKRLDRSELRAFVREACGTYFHPTGTCAMGTGKEAVVDQDLKVRGIKGLRVADASVMPQIPTANTNAATLMIGEFLAKSILAQL